MSSLALVFLIATSESSFAQERTASGNLQMETTWTALKGLAEQANNNAKTAHIKLKQLETCNAKGMFYAPENTSKDADGCIGGAGKIVALRSNSSALSGLTPNKNYLVSVYGTTADVAHIVVRACGGGAVLSQTASTWSTGRRTPDSAVLAITAPASGCIQGFTKTNQAANSVHAFTIE